MIYNKIYSLIENEFPLLKAVVREATALGNGLDRLRVEQLIFEKNQKAVTFTACLNGRFHVQEWIGNSEKYSTDLHSLDVAKERLNSFFQTLNLKCTTF